MLKVSAQQLTVTPLMHSAGYTITLPAGYDPDSTAYTLVRYRPNGQTWQPAFPASRLSLTEFRGSLVQLTPDTEYELEIVIADTVPFFTTDTVSTVLHTRAVPDIQPSGTMLWVSSNGSGSSYTESNPGNLQTLISTGLSCGTTVLLKGGTYPLGDLILNLTQDCPENSPIILMAAPGETPVLDGGSYDTYTWYPGTGDTTIWWTNLPADLEFNALCLVNGQRMYPYAWLTPSSMDPTYPSLWTLGYGLSGFYRNKWNQVFIKTLDGININDAQVIFSKKYSCLTVYGNNKNIRLRIKGIQFQYYGKGRCDKDFFGNPTVCYPSTTLRFIDASDVQVDSCTFTYCNFPVLFEGNCNQTSVTRCQIADGTGYWSHAAFKRTADVFFPLFDPNYGSYGRYLENVGIHYRPYDGQTTQGNIVWRNSVQGVVTGIGLGSLNTAILSENDIGQNTISWCFDGIDAIGQHRNVRIWGNQVGYCPVGISLIADEQKPAYIYRNVLHHLDQRQNYLNDPSFVDCNNVQTQQSWGTALKLNAGGEPKGGDLIYFIHNTVHGTEPYAFNLYLWTAAWKVLDLRNNIFYAEGDANLFFDGISSQPQYPFASVRNNFFNASGGATGIVRLPSGGPLNCGFAPDPDSLFHLLTDVTGSAGISFSNDLQAPPQFLDPQNLDFNLQATSPLIDQAVAVAGFNNAFSGQAPDLGALESDWTTSLPALHADQSISVFPNPASETVLIRWSGCSSPLHLTVWNAQGQLMTAQAFVHPADPCNSLQLHTANWSPGWYLIRLTSAARTAQTQFVKGQ
ncbi:MAG: T9SS type A sorting domain-containing protein [Chitinophagales bacterium]|nr:T9SS type A sorting domain-containing protein [Chitinophagales bacterium]MDW8394540.1 T9SS type A sorting domain-containing protein [Chitinophagales bacterium]